jgi:hypothetical protein
MRQDPNHQTTWLPTRPEFTVVCEHARGTSTNRGYHESFYQIVSRHALDEDDFKRLDACGLLGIGQAFYVEKSDTFKDEVKPVTYDKRTGQILDVPPVNWQGQPITNTTEYGYHRYSVKRICDSGD